MINFPKPAALLMKDFDHEKWLISYIQELRKTTGYKIVFEKSISNRILSLANANDAALEYRYILAAVIYEENKFFLCEWAQPPVQQMILEAIANDLSIFYTDHGFKFELQLIAAGILNYKISW